MTMSNVTFVRFWYSSIATPHQCCASICPTSICICSSWRQSWARKTWPAPSQPSGDRNSSLRGTMSSLATLGSLRAQARTSDAFCRFEWTPSRWFSWYVVPFIDRSCVFRYRNVVKLAP